MELLRLWFNGDRNYYSGVQLYLQYGANAALKAFFQAPATPFREEKLAETIKEMLIGKDDDPTANFAPSAFELPANTASTDPIVEEFYRRKALLHKQKDQLRYTLENIDTDEERGVAAHNILRLRKKITDIWQQELYYKEHGRLLEEDPGITDPFMLKQRRTSVNGNIRRLRSLLKKFPDHAGHLASMKKFQAEYAQLQAKIKKYKNVING